MEFHFTPEQEAFREEIRQFLREEITPELRRDMAENPEDGSVHKEFSRKVGARGWIGLSWPKGFGGKSIGSGGVGVSTWFGPVAIDPAKRAGDPCSGRDSATDDTVLTQAPG